MMGGCRSLLASAHIVLNPAVRPGGRGQTEMIRPQLHSLENVNVFAYQVWLSMIGGVG